MAASTDIFTPEVLDRRVVSISEDGTRAEWRLMSDPSGVSVWQPFHVAKDGSVLNRPAWMPLPGSQLMFLTCPVFEALYEGWRSP